MMTNIRECTHAHTHTHGKDISGVRTVFLFLAKWLIWQTSTSPVTGLSSIYEATVCKPLTTTVNLSVETSMELFPIHHLRTQRFTCLSVFFLSVCLFTCLSLAHCSAAVHPLDVSILSVIALFAISSNVGFSHMQLCTTSAYYAF